MDPLIWGPCMWKTLFSIAFNIKQVDVPQMVKMLKLVEKVLPCPTCRTHYALNRQGVDNLFPLKNVDNIQYWLWHMKSMVNKELKTPDTEFKYIKNRYDAFDHNICDTELADILMIVCISCKSNVLKQVHEFLFILGNLCSKFLQGPLPALLLCVENVNRDTMLKFVNTIREYHNIPSRTNEHYDKLLEL